MKTKFFFSFAFLLFGLTLALVSPVQAQESEELTCDNPQVSYLIDKTGATCEEILALHEAGVGLGEIMKAAVLADGLDDETISWESLLEAHQNDIGWGELSHAYGLADRFSQLGLSGEELLALKQEDDRGWGPLIHASAIAGADLGLSFDEALDLFDSGMGWGDIRAELELPPGPPPWAGQGAGMGENGPPPHAAGADKERQPGPPPWAGGDDDGDDDDEEPEDEEASSGPPPWAGGPDNDGDENDDTVHNENEGRDNGRGRGNGRGNGQGANE